MGDILDYTLTNVEDDKIFKIDRTNGNVTSRISFDYENKPVYTFKVTITGPGALSDVNTPIITSTITLNINNINDITVYSISGSPMNTDGTSKIILSGTNLGQLWDNLSPPLR